MIEINRELCSYFAGFFDGEGCIASSFYTVSNRRDGYKRVKIGICISNTDIRPLELIQLCFGGNITKTKNKFNTNMQLFRWNLYNKQDILKFLNNIFPFSIVKKE